MSFFQLLMERWDEVIFALQDHLVLVAIPIGLASLVAIPLGIIATRNRWVELIVMTVASVLQTIPSLARSEEHV